MSLKAQILIFLSIFGLIQGSEDIDWEVERTGGDSKVVDIQKYFDTVTERTIVILEEHGFTQSVFPILDFTHPINLTQNGFTADGDVTFHSGFIQRIESVPPTKPVNPLPDSEINDKQALIRALMIFNNISFVYDLDMDFPGLEEDKGTIIITFDKITFKIEVKMVFETGVVTPSCSFNSIDGTQYNIDFQAFPYHHHMQMIAKAITTKYDLREKIFESTKAWQLTQFFYQAVKEFDFPLICYYC